MSLQERNDMKALRPYPRITITPKGEAALTGGHPWVYEGEVTAADGTPGSSSSATYHLSTMPLRIDGQKP